MRAVLFLLFCCTLLGCEKEHTSLSADELLGDYQLQHVEITDAMGQVLLEKDDNAKWLGLQPESFYQTYISGNWAVEGNRLTLSYTSDMNWPDRVYLVTYLKDDRLTLRWTGPKRHYYYPVPGTTEDDVVTVTEEYLKASE